MDNQDIPVGRFVLKPFRQLLEDSRPAPIGRKALDILSVLAQANGALVTKDELMAAVWPKTIVEDNAIQVHVAALRKTLGADAELLSTVHGMGYRLVPTVPPAPSAPTPGAATPETLIIIPSQRRAAVRWLVAALAVVTLVGGAAAWLSRPPAVPASHWSVENSRPFVFGLALDDYPAFSANGAMLAYTSGPEGGARQIYVRAIAGGEAVRLTHDDSDDTSPSWSSDGARLAYVAQKAGEPCHIMVITFPAGAAHEAGRCRAAQTSTVAWQPRTPLLYFAERSGLKGDVLYRLDLDSGAVTTIVREPALHDIISSLRCSPDGKWLAYILSGDKVVIRNLAGGQAQTSEKSLGLIATRGVWSSWLAWSDDSQTVLVTVTTGSGGSQIMAFPMDSSPPYRVYATELNIGHIAVASGMLAMETDTSRSNVARATATPDAPPDIISPASGQTWSPTFAPDGTLAFLSNRSGSNAIWTLKPGATAPAQLLDLGFTPAYRIRYSPDGTELAMAIETTESVVVKVMNAGGATLTTFTMPSLGLGLPSWTPDGKALFLFDRGPKQTFQIDAANPARRFAFAAPHWVGIALYKGGAYATRADKNGIWRIDGKAPVRITDKYPAYHDPPLAFRDDAVLLTHFDGGPRFFAQPLDGGAERFAGYAPGMINTQDYQSTVAVNPANGQITYTLRVVHETSIDLLTLAKK